MRYFVVMQAISSGASEAGRKMLLAQTERVFRQMEDLVPPRWLNLRDTLVSAVSDTLEDFKVFNPLGWVRDPQRADDPDIL